MTWLIQGHLKEEDALEMVRVAEASINFTRIQESEINLPRCVELKEKTIYSYENRNVLAKSSNSCINVIHQIRYDDDRDKAAVVHVVASLLNDPAYKTLRTKE